MEHSGQPKANEPVVSLDAVIIGAGFGGLYAIKKLRDDLGLDVLAFDTAGGIGGTWYWNRYPGALSDSESHVYAFSWDEELLQEWDLKRRFIPQPEILRYLEHVAERHDLNRSIRLNTRIVEAAFDESAGRWMVTTDKGQKYSAKYLITALGLLSATNVPTIKGQETFKGDIYHTSRWPKDANIKGKRVGVVGTGSSGVQTITAIAPDVKHLTVFQRSAQYTVPSGDGPLRPEEVAQIKKNFRKIWDDVKNSPLGFGFELSATPTMSVSEEERERIFNEAWKVGGGFRFMFETFSDMGVDLAANKAAQDFIRKKIGEIVKDPETARKLMPTELHAKRPLCDAGYYETFNRPNVSLVDIKATPIVEITPNGVKTADGVIHELDVLVFATGFDAVDGNFKRIELRGRKGLRIQDHWKDGSSSYLSVTTSHFPNMFMILGPNGPFSNLPPAIEIQVDWIGDVVGYMESHGVATFEATEQAEEEWGRLCAEIAEQTLFAQTASWIFGANIPGKKKSAYFYMGGLNAFRDKLKEATGTKFKDFKLEKEKEHRLA
jgi:cation diffusion facilitator CzcD-associated flavoprotein CzcO